MPLPLAFTWLDALHTVRHSHMTGKTNWVAQAISKNSLVAVTEGYYIKEHYPNLCSVAFVLECTQGQGRAIGAFPEASAAANVYQGELLGLTAVHMLLLAVKSDWSCEAVLQLSRCSGPCGRTPPVLCSYSMLAFRHPEDNSSQLWWSLIPSGISTTSMPIKMITLDGRT